MLCQASPCFHNKDLPTNILNAHRKEWKGSLYKAKVYTVEKFENTKHKLELLAKSHITSLNSQNSKSKIQLSKTSTAELKSSQGLSVEVKL